MCDCCACKLQTVEAVSSAIAQTITHLSTYVCSCCTGNSGAYTVVGADVQVRTLGRQCCC